MSDMKKLSDEALENVTGGRIRVVKNDAGANIRSGPGTRYEKLYHLGRGREVDTNGERVYNDADGYDWVQLDDGGWVSLMTAAGSQPTCLGFEIHSHACRI